MGTYRVYQVDAFTREPFTGNAASVVTRADGLSDKQMQDLARELNNSETAFILSPSAADHDVHVRFFTPTTEVPSCGHATVAAHYARARELNLPSCTLLQKIGIGILPVDIVRNQDEVTVVMTQGKVEIAEPFGTSIGDGILAALGVEPAEVDPRCPLQIASTGHSKVMVGLRRQETLHRLEPDLGALVDLSKTIGCNGYFVFTLDAPEGDLLAHGRMFAPAIGIAEDPVTGNGNGPLGAYLAHHGMLAGADAVTRHEPRRSAAGGSTREGQTTLSFKARQGEAMGRPGTVKVAVEMDGDRPAKIQVAGQATIVFRTEVSM